MPWVALFVCKISVRELIPMKKIASLVFVAAAIMLALQHGVKTSEATQDNCGAPYVQPNGVSDDDDKSLSFIVMGDTGKASDRRARSIAALSAAVADKPLSFAVLLGDNFYQRGINSVDDIRWAADFEKLFSSVEFNIPFYSILGNHDYRGNIQAQLDYSQKSQRWTMPSPYYALRKPLDSAGQQTVLILMLDTEKLRADAAMQGEQLRWIESELASATDAFVILIGHHPVYSYGRHGGDPVLQKIFKKLGDAHRIDLYINGHEHDFQMIKAEDETLFVSNGGFSKRTPARCGPGSIFASNDTVALLVTVSSRHIYLQPVNIDGTLGNSYRL